METKKFLVQVIYLKKTDLDVKLVEIESKIPSIIGLATKSALTVVENKIHDVSNLVKKKQTDLNCKVIEIESKIPSITDLTTNSALTAVKNKIPDVSSLVKKTAYDAKILQIENKVSDRDHDKYIATSEFNKLTTETFQARLAQADLVTKTEYDSKIGKSIENLSSIDLNMKLLEIR